MHRQGISSAVNRNSCYGAAAPHVTPSPLDASLLYEHIAARRTLSPPRAGRYGILPLSASGGQPPFHNAYRTISIQEDQAVLLLWKTWGANF